MRQLLEIFERAKYCELTVLKILLHEDKYERKIPERMFCRVVLAVQTPSVTFPNVTNETMDGALDPVSTN